MCTRDKLGNELQMDDPVAFACMGGEGRKVYLQTGIIVLKNAEHQYIEVRSKAGRISRRRSDSVIKIEVPK